MGVEEKEETLVWPALGNACVQGARPASVINELHDELNQLEEPKSRDGTERERWRKREELVSRVG